MAIKKCENGHFFNPDMFPTCPFCKKPEEDDDKTVMMAHADLPSYLGNLQRRNQETEVPFSADVGTACQRVVAGTVGWIFCVKGPDYGKMYPLAYGKNYVILDDDANVLRIDQKKSDFHAAFMIEYQEKDDKFLFYEKEGRSNISDSDDDFKTGKDIQYSDILTCLDTEFMFLPLCGKKFNWKK